MSRGTRCDGRSQGHPFPGHEQFGRGGGQAAAAGWELSGPIGQQQEGARPAPAGQTHADSERAGNQSGSSSAERRVIGRPRWPSTCLRRASRSTACGLEDAGGQAVAAIARQQARGPPWPGRRPRDE